MSSPVRVWPVLQEYVATELYVVVGADTIPFAGLPSVPQSTAVQEILLLLNMLHLKMLGKRPIIIDMIAKTHFLNSHFLCFQPDIHIRCQSSVHKVRCKYLRTCQNHRNTGSSQRPTVQHIAQDLRCMMSGILWIEVIIIIRNKLSYQYHVPTSMGRAAPIITRMHVIIINNMALT